MESRSEAEELRGELAKRDLVIGEQAKLIASLTARVEEVEALLLQQAELLRRTSKNSNLPPSSDRSGKGVVRKRKKGRKRGGQKGHKGSHRRLLPPEKVDEVVPMYPARCAKANCGAWLPKSPSGQPRRHQHTCGRRTATPLSGSPSRITETECIES